MVESIKLFMNNFAESIVTFLGFGVEAANYVYVFLISMIPVVELRGALPVAYALDLHPIASYITALLGNLFPVPFILFLITPLCRALQKTKILAWFPRWMERKVEKNRDKIERYKFWGLCIFVAIPLPGTGAWTGALAAAFLNYKFKDAFLSILCGVCIAGVIVSLISFGIFGVIIN
ncbi:MAG: small multi-drug export protein [Clostridia bacterium]|nr:small multi-drug export protein [Clostridia bacterium]